MTQADVIKYLKKNKGRWVSTKEVSRALGLSSAYNNLNKMFRYGEIERELKLNPNKSGGFIAYWKLK